MKDRALITFLSIVLFLSAFSQELNIYKPGNIRQKLEQLNVLGSVLYVAAHPDDENTRLIAYYANDQLMRTAYLSATRGDGGQNLIGSEIREELGLIRTQELLAARKIDGGQQFFSRANDFGYSKNPEEALSIWDKEEVLADFVWIFRKFKPDVVITRFSDNGRTHGHHTASAILAREAFSLSGDENAFPEHLQFVDPWKPKKLFWNTGWWWFRDGSVDTTNLNKVDVGGFNPLLGESYTEMAARSRSMHKSQGFGSSGSRGTSIEYLQQWEGISGNAVFEGIDTSWKRVEGSEEVSFFINKAIEAYDETNPSAILEPLMGARAALEKLGDPFWKSVNQKQIDELVKAVTGLFISLSVSSERFSAGDSISISLEAVNRSDANLKLEQISFEQWNNPISFQVSLLNNRPFKTEMKFKLPEGMKPSHPYWLEEEGTMGLYKVSDQVQRGIPENNPPIVGRFVMDFNGEKIIYKVPVMFRRTDPVQGEVVQPITISPPVMVNIEGGVFVFGDDNMKTVNVRVVSGKDKGMEGRVSLNLPKEWKAIPESVAFSLNRKGEEQVCSFQIIPPKTASEAWVQAEAKVEGKTYTRGLVNINYDHIPRQVLYPQSKAKLVRIDLKKKGERIGYIAGAGDEIPQNLEAIGYKITYLEKEDVSADNLKQYDAVILGVRAFNTVDWLAYKNKDLFEYVKQGGTVIVQYNTSHRLVTNEIAPYDLKLSRDRVSVENAPVKIIAPDHPVVRGPNAISADDFENWVQERGLYFPSEWSDAFIPILESNDPGETPKKGGLLVAKYGRGYYVYSGYSWFRQLPAGVSGAYRIFVNLISLGK